MAASNHEGAGDLAVPVSAGTPAVRLREELTAARRRGDPFDTAWAAALAHALDGIASAEWALALAWSRPAFQEAYAGRGTVALTRAQELRGLAEVAVQGTPRGRAELLA